LKRCPSCPAHGNAFLRGVVFVGDAVLGAGLDQKRVTLGAVRDRNQRVVCAAS
jgi:hypothetical protein